MSFTTVIEQLEKAQAKMEEIQTETEALEAKTKAYNEWFNGIVATIPELNDSSVIHLSKIAILFYRKGVEHGKADTH